jgi:hemoglobin
MTTRRFVPLLLLAAGCMEGHKPEPIARVGEKPPAKPARGAIAALDVEPAVKEKEKSGPKASLYARLGGKDGIRRIVDDFCTALLESDAIREVHKKHIRDGDVDALKRKLRDQFGEESGGPQKYTGRSMKDAHKGLGITEADFAALVAALVKALEKNNVPEREQKELLTKLARYKDDVIEAPGEPKGGTNKDE